MKLTATETLTYAGRKIRAGEDFDCDDPHDAALLTRSLHPRAREAHPADRGYETAALDLGAPAPKTPRKGGRYGRRDMRAEG